MVLCTYVLQSAFFVGTLIKENLAEEQGILDPKAPGYVDRKHGGIIPDEEQEIGVPTLARNEQRRAESS